MAAVSAERGNGFEDHVLAELHELGDQLREFKQLLDEYRPLLETWRRMNDKTNGGTIGVVRAARAMRSGRA